MHHIDYKIYKKPRELNEKKKIWPTRLTTEFEDHIKSASWFLKIIVSVSEDSHDLRGAVGGVPIVL